MRSCDQANIKNRRIPYLGMAVLMSCIVLLLLAGIAAGGLSAAELHTPTTTTTLWARTQDFAQFELSSVTAPSFIVSGADCLDTGEMNI